METGEKEKRYTCRVELVCVRTKGKWNGGGAREGGVMRWSNHCEWNAGQGRGLSNEETKEGDSGELTMI